MKDKIENGCILMVDDDESIRESLGELLGACGFKIYQADCYDAAVKVLGEEKDIETILCDLKMPGKSGLEVLRHVNAKHKHIPLVFLTGFGTLESCQEAVREGAFDYILKPIDDKDKVIFPLSHAVEKHRLEKRNRELQQEIIQLAEEHQRIITEILEDTEIKSKVQDRISKILDKWKA